MKKQTLRIFYYDISGKGFKLPNVKSTLELISEILLDKIIKQVSTLRTLEWPLLAIKVPF